MNRAYRFGAVALAVVAAGLVFAFLVPPVQLTEYDATGDEFRKTAIFLHDGREVFPVSVLNEPLPASGRARLVVELGDRAGIRIESVTIGIRGSTEAYLEALGGDFPVIRFQHATDGGYGSILEIPDTGVQGNGAMMIPFLLQSYGDRTENLTIDIEAGLSETGFPWRRYEARHRFEV
ncbi:hypothetical protein [Methanoculleus chikugoensis]|uniref:DUF8121 domain-containing protein n=1 Tax=Methanoculleus chikugoensis TaxID=118126 RepID=A0ABM7H7N5_9EURY|nr:hypothetical protein [Methanoculleus chikugoensis]BBL68788.1 hypothetical protein MchiMG62_19690 [Methanoculleus chikugoensis]